MKHVTPPSSAPGSPHSRKIHYIDHVLQKWLLIALVALEVIVLSVAGGILYWKLSQVADEALYRIHFGQQPSLFSVLLKEAMWVLTGLVTVNLLALFMADRIWVRYVRSIVLSLRDLLAKSRELDFSEDTEMLRRHKVVTLALDWRHHERARLLMMRDLIQAASTDTLATNDEFRDRLLVLRQHLP